MTTQTQTKPTQKMLGSLQPGDRIQFPLFQAGRPSTTLVDSKVVEVCRLTEGWHRVVTEDYGALKVHDPTFKYSIVK
ncbi:MAG: hypothetical protein WBB28_19300 [Crinalium sp.]